MKRKLYLKKNTSCVMSRREFTIYNLGTKYHRSVFIQKKNKNKNETII